MKLKKCPRCGNRNVSMAFRCYSPKWKVACEYCRFMPDKPAWTQTGAKRIWNKASCTRIIRKKVPE